MAKKTTTSKALDSEVARELEEALDLDFAGGADGDLDIAASMEDLEAQISQAADELARAGKAAEPVSNRAVPNRSADERPKAELRPAEPNGRAQPAGFSPAPAGFSPANDDRQKDYRSLLQGLDRRASNTIYWVVAFVSVAWIAGAAALANLLFGPGIWDIRSVGELVARPELMGMAVAAVVPLVLFWAFAAMVRPARALRRLKRPLAQKNNR